MVLLGEGRLRIAPGLALGGVLGEEIEAFKIEKVRQDDALVEWRTRPQEDLVIATLMACWVHTERELGTVGYAPGLWI